MLAALSSFAKTLFGGTIGGFLKEGARMIAPVLLPWVFDKAKSGLEYLFNKGS